MEFYKQLVLMICSFILSGCIILPGHLIKKPSEQPKLQPKTEAPFYRWQAPIVQEVQIPAHVINGVMIPEHKELVIIKPGEWIFNANQ